MFNIVSQNCQCRWIKLMLNSLPQRLCLQLITANHVACILKTKMLTQFSLHFCSKLVVTQRIFVLYHSCQPEFRCGKISLADFFNFQKSCEYIMMKKGSRRYGKLGNVHNYYIFPLFTTMLALTVCLVCELEFLVCFKYYSYRIHPG